MARIGHVQHVLRNRCAADVSATVQKFQRIDSKENPVFWCDFSARAMASLRLAPCSSPGDSQHLKTKRIFTDWLSTI
jgi:hypothetical protein